MNRKLIVLVCCLILLVVALLGALINVEKWFYRVYPGSYNPYIESMLLSNVGIIGGELLDKSELKAFYQSFEGDFTGYYDTMPENVKRLTEQFAARISNRYHFMFNDFSASKVEVNVNTSPAAKDYTIVFSFEENGTHYSYRYSELQFAEKKLMYIVPTNTMIIANLPDWHYVKFSFIHYSNDLTTINKRVVDLYNDNLNSDSISVEDYNVYINIARGIKRGQPLTIDYIKKIVEKTKTAQGPVTVFGLRPLQNKSAELLSEDVIFTKDVSYFGNLSGVYDVEMNYKIKSDDTSEFILPFTHLVNYTPEEMNYPEFIRVQDFTYSLPKVYNTPVKIYVDDVPVEYIASIHPMAYVERSNERDWKYKPSQYQSVFAVPGYENPLDQSDLTYESLMNAVDKTAFDLTLNTMFTVYDISSADKSWTIDNSSFQTSDSIDGQLSLLFTDGMSWITSGGSENNSKSINYNLHDVQNPEKKLLAILGDIPSEFKLLVKNIEIKAKRMTLNEIISEVFQIPEESKQNYLAQLSQFLTTKSQIHKTHIVRREIKPSGIVDMLKFKIDKPGEHNITIKLKAIGENDLCDYHMLEWADSPRDAWSSVGSRKLAINIKDKKYDYFITDEILKFKQEKTEK